jgi:hypothetical protein
VCLLHNEAAWDHNVASVRRVMNLVCTGPIWDENAFRPNSFPYMGGMNLEMIIIVVFSGGCFLVAAYLFALHSQLS